MNPKKKKIGLIVVAILVLVIAVFAYKFDQPGEIPPSQNSIDWESSITTPDIIRERLFIKSGDVHLEADLLIPAGGGVQKGAVIFSPGSGANTYQDYFGIKIRQKYVKDLMKYFKINCRKTFKRMSSKVRRIYSPWLTTFVPHSTRKDNFLVNTPAMSHPYYRTGSLSRDIRRRSS